MCGIFGVVARKGDIAKNLLIIARQLQYIGYDNLGLATYIDGEIDLRKDMGNVEIPLQLLALFMSIERGINPDYPRNLSKTLTVD
ncbi:MAG: hypothetical protein R3255_06425 [Candidatus Lokiarchaeia archaeon]|nr:hypothetical protein [Candidatus Lokiarchaeia archaeon]